MKPKYALRHFLALAGSSILAASSASAGQIWDGTGANTNWNTAANWDGDALPDFTSAITFAGTTRPTNVNNLAADTTIGGINFTNTSGTFSISGNRITLGGNIVTTAAGAAMTDTLSLAMILDGNRTITTNTLHNLTLSGIISGTGTHSLIKDGAGDLILNTGNTFSGGFTLNSGRVVGIGAGTYGGFGTGTLTVTGGTIGASSSSAVTIDNALNWGGSLTIVRSGGSSGTPTFTFTNTLTLSSNFALNLGVSTTAGAAAFTNNISGAFGINVVSGGPSAVTNALTLSGANNTFSGGLSLTGGTRGMFLNINSATALGATAGTFTISSGGVVIDNTSAAAITLTNNNPLAINTNFTFTGTRDLNMGTGAVNLGGAIRSITTTTNGSIFTLGGVISNGGLTKAGAGTLVLSGASDYVSATAVNAGLLNVTGTLTSAVTVASNAFLSGTGTTTGTLTLSTGSTIVGTTAGSSFKAATVTATGVAGVKIAGSDGSGTIGSHTIGVVRYNTGTGPATANFSTANYHAGASVANVGTSGGETQLTYTNQARTWNSAAATWDVMSTTAWAEGDFQYGHGDALTFDDTGTGGGAARAVTLNSLATPGSVTFNNSTSTPYTVSGTGAIAGPTGLTKSGNGTVTLSNTNTYTGATTVTGGALIVNGNITTSLVSVAANATLGGSGTIGGNTTISGIHSPGNSPGIITHGGDLTYESGASVLWELVANSTASRGTNFDGINVGGALDFNGTTTLNLSFNFGASAVEWQDAFWAGSYAGTNGWLVYSGATSLDGFAFLGLNAPALWLDESGDTLAAIRSDRSFGLYQDGNNIYLTYAAIPEPGAALLGSLGVLLLFRRRR